MRLTDLDVEQLNPEQLKRLCSCLSVIGSVRADLPDVPIDPDWLEELAGYVLGELTVDELMQRTLEAASAQYGLPRRGR